MRSRRFLCISALLGAVLSPLAAQEPPDDPDVKLPNGKSQRDEILRIEHDKSVRDAGRLVKLAAELESDLQKNDYRVLSVGILKKTDEIERLARTIRARMRRF